MEKFKSSLSSPCGLLVILALVVIGPGLAAARQGAAAGPPWSFNATIIEACSCPMFCQCYFNPRPAAHGGHGEHGEERFCRFNRAFRVNKGNFGRTEIAKVKFWMARVGDKAFEFKGTTGFMVTIDMTSEDIKQ